MIITLLISIHVVNLSCCEFTFSLGLVLKLIAEEYHECCQKHLDKLETNGIHKGSGLLLVYKYICFVLTNCLSQSQEIILK